MNELTKRVIVAAIGIPSAVILILWGDLYFKLAVFILGVFAAGEYSALVSKKTNNFSGWFTILFTGIFLFVLTQFKYPLIIAFSTLLLIFLLVLSTFTLQLRKGPSEGLLSISATFTGVFYIAFGFAAIMIIREFNLVLLHWNKIFNQSSFFYSLDFAVGETWGLMVLFIFISIWACDSAAYFIGKPFGKHKLLPNVSPKKSVEGAIAGLIGAVLTFTILSYFFIPELPWWVSLTCGVIIGTIGQIGDLAESLLKRDAGVKDSSNILPGHGGILDRFDSALFVFPAITAFFMLLAFVK